jgi:hypothetical protein
MIDQENEGENKNPMSAFAIVGINIGSLIAYMTFVFNTNMSDSTAAFFLFFHVLICVAFAINSKRPVWWISACIVAFSLISVLTQG